MKRIAVYVLIAVLFSAITCRSVGAQSTAQVSGTVKDQTGAVLPGVEVTATQTNTALKRTVLTEATGSYILPNLPVGAYRLVAAIPRIFELFQIILRLSFVAKPRLQPHLLPLQVSNHTL